MRSPTKYKHDKIVRLLNRFAESREFDGIALAVISVQGDKVHSTLRSGMTDVNLLIGLETIIDKINY